MTNNRDSARWGVPPVRAGQPFDVGDYRNYRDPPATSTTRSSAPRSSARSSVQSRPFATAATTRPAAPPPETVPPKTSRPEIEPPIAPPPLETADAAPAVIHPPVHDDGGGAADFAPVPRQRVRRDGWTVQRQRAFITALADSGSVREAAAMAGVSPRSAYQLRRAKGAEDFARAWDMALQQAVRVLTDIAFERAVNGTSEPVFNRDGIEVGTRQRLNDRLLMFLLRHHRQEIYGIGPERVLDMDERAAAQSWQSGHSPLPDALAALGSDGDDDGD